MIMKTKPVKNIQDKWSGGEIGKLPRGGKGGKLPKRKGVKFPRGGKGGKKLQRGGIALFAP